MQLSNVTVHYYISLRCTFFQSTTAYEAGNYQQALAAAHTARTLNILGLVVGIVTFIVIIALSVVGAFV